MLNTQGYLPELKYSIALCHYLRKSYGAALKDIAEIIIERTKSTSEIVFVPYEEAYAEGFEDMPRRIPDVSRLLATTGFRPTTSLEKIIDDVVVDLRARGVAAP